MVHLGAQQPFKSTLFSASKKPRPLGNCVRPAGFVINLLTKARCVNQSLIPAASYEVQLKG